LRSTKHTSPTAQISKGIIFFLLGLAAAGLVLFPSLLLGQEQKNLIQQGAAALEKHDYDLAVACYGKAIQVDPKNGRIYYDRAIAYNAKGDHDKAISDYSEAIRFNPKLVEAYYNRATAYETKGDYDKAIANYDEAIRLNPKLVQAYNNRGGDYEAKGDYAKAIADYDEAIRVDPKYAVGCNNLGWLLGTCPQPQFRDGKKAVEYATKACELTDWKMLTFVDTLAAACAEAGDFERAVKWEKKYLETPKLSEKATTDAKGRLRLYESHQPYHADK
jgi:tetratricopeptide (TPR) repeat protein